MNPYGSYQSNNLLNELTCPVSLEPLSKAVALFPCAHKIQQHVARKLFGSCSSSIEPGKTCPVCVQPVSAYMIDRGVRNIVHQLAQMTSEDAALAVAEVKNALSQQESFMEKEPAFVCSKINYSWDNTVRSCHFENCDSSIPLRKISFCDDVGHDDHMLIEFAPGDAAASEYLKTLNIELSSKKLAAGQIKLDCCYRNTDKFFKILEIIDIEDTELMTKIKKDMFKSRFFIKCQ